MVARVAKGHGDEFTVIVRSKGKDKAQVCSVQLSMVEGSCFSPKEMCEHIRDMLQDNDLPGLEGPIRDAPVLAVIREKAFEYRDAILAQS